MMTERKNKSKTHPEKKTKDSDEKKSKKEEKQDTLNTSDKIVIVGFLFLIGLVLTLVLVIKYSKDTDVVTQLPNDEPINVTYNGFEFEYVNPYWHSEGSINGNKYLLDYYYNPVNLTDIPIRKNIKQVFGGVDTVYLTLDPEIPVEGVVAGVEISKTLGTIFGKTIIAGITREGIRNHPIITCENTNATSRVILLKISNETRIDLENGCVIVKGSSTNDLLRAADRLSYEFLGIMDENRIGIN